MNLKQLKEIKSELKRFQERVEEAIKLAESVEGWKEYNTEDVYGKHDISGTRMSGAVKRGAQELKYFLTKKI
jgi:carbamoylphosphate synthase large subunit